MIATAELPVFSPNGGALIASPDSSLREKVLHRLNGRCRPVQQALGGADALAKLEKGDWQVLFLDRRLPDLDAEELSAVIRRRFPGILVVFLENDSRMPEAEERPACSALSQRPVRKESPLTSEGNLHKAPLPGMIGSSEPMQNVYRMVRLVACRNTTVLIVGQTGTGKELIARAVHALSPRSAKPLVVVNCAAIPESLLESELFGYTRGAFTGAVQSQLGRIPAAHGGTLFLDEVSELPLGMQAKLLRFLEQKEIQRLGATDTMRVDVRVVAASNADLAARAARGEFRQDLYYRLSAFPIELPALAQVRLLRVLQEQEIERVGGGTSIKIDVRVISATNRHLEELVARGEFREDLFFRLNVFPIYIPPLRERKSDIPALVHHFIEKKCRQMVLPTIPGLAPGEIDRLMNYDWPGNVRELENAVERAIIVSRGKLLTFRDILNTPQGRTEEVDTMEEAPSTLREGEARQIRKALEKAAGKVSGTGSAAELLGINPGTLRHRMRKLGIPFGRTTRNQRRSSSAG